MGINSKIGIITVLLIGYTSCFGQSLDVGIGLGNVMMKREFERSKSLIYFHFNHDLSARWNVGFYYNAGGDFLIPFGETEKISGDTTFLFPESIGLNSLFATALANS